MIVLVKVMTIDKIGRSFTKSIILKKSNFLNDLNSLFRSGINSLSTAVDSILAIQAGYKLGIPYFIAISFFKPHISNRQFRVSSCKK